jgi:hypothetical protein
MVGSLDNGEERKKSSFALITRHMGVPRASAPHGSQTISYQDQASACVKPMRKG